METILKGLVGQGALGLMCSVLFYAVYVLWKRCNNLTDEVIKLATGQVEINTKYKSALDGIEKGVNDILDNQTGQYRIPGGKHEPRR